MTISFNFSRDVDEEHVMHTKSDTKEFMTCDNTNCFIDKLFKSLLSRYQENIETWMEGSEFVFDLLYLLYYKYHRINFKRDGWYIYSPASIKKKKAIINS